MLNFLSLTLFLSLSEISGKIIGRNSMPIYGVWNGGGIKRGLTEGGGTEVALYGRGT